LGAVICIDQTAVIILLCALVHEFGHLFACLIFNAEIKEFNLTVIGFGIVKSPVTSLREILITVAGPFAGLTLSAAAFLLGYNQIGVISLFLSAINLIPVPPLDGDRILREILSPVFILTINVFALASLFVSGIYLAIKYINFTVLLFSLLMLCCFFGKYKQGISTKMFRDFPPNF